MSEEIVVKPEAVQDVVKVEAEPVDQLVEIRKAAHEVIDQCDGFILIPFKQVDAKTQDGQSVKITKTMINGGAMGGGQVNLPFVVKTCNLLLASENQNRNEQLAAMAE